MNKKVVAVQLCETVLSRFNLPWCQYEQVLLKVLLKLPAVQLCKTVLSGFNLPRCQYEHRLWLTRAPEWN